MTHRLACRLPEMCKKYKTADEYLTMKTITILQNIESKQLSKMKQSSQCSDHNQRLKCVQ